MLTLFCYLCSEMVALFQRPGFDDTHATSHVLLLDPSGENAHLIAGICLLQDLVEHLDAGYLALALFVVANNFDFISNLNDKIRG